MPDYPIVHRVSDPLMIRTSRFALQINDTIYWAKIKFGNSFCGFYGFVTGSSEHFYEYKDEELTESWSQSSRSRTPTVSERTVKETLEQAAQDWLDKIENALLEQKPDNAIKKAIDRLCWQLHYDLTASDTDFTQFDDFADVSIDMAANTIYNTVTTLATTLGNAIGDGADVIIGDSTSGAGIWSVSNTISGMSTSVCGKLDTMSNNISTLDSNLNGSSGSIKTYIGDVIYSSGDTGSTPTTLCGYINKVATNLRADDSGNYQEYTISRALREYVPGASSQEKSVSGATKDQTDLEQEHFETISQDQLGAFGETGNRTLFATIGSYATDGNNTMSQAIGQTNEDENSSSLTGRVERIKITIGDSSDGLVKTVNGIDAKMGVPLDENGQEMTTGGDTLFDAVYRHPGFLGYNNHGFGGYLPSTNGSLVSTINQDVLSGTTGIKGTVNTINNKIGTVPATAWSVYNYLENIYSNI